MVGLFQNTPLIGHSGQALSWKIDCDALTPEDWAWAAARVAERVSFYNVYGIPDGGVPFARALWPHRRDGGEYFLIVDDVLTTGGSLRSAHGLRSECPVLGVVLFARIPPPEPWIKALFLMQEW